MTHRKLIAGAIAAVPIGLIVAILGMLIVTAVRWSA